MSAETSPPQPRPLWLRLWPLWAALLLFVFAVVTARQRMNPSWEWAGEPVPPGSAVKAAGRTIEASPSNLAAILEAVQPGDLILLADGEYSLPKPAVSPTTTPNLGQPSTKGMFVLARSGVEGRPITIKARGGAARFRTGFAVQGAAWVVIDGIKFSNTSDVAFFADKCEHLTVRNSTMDAASCARAAQVSDSKFVIFEGNEAFGAVNGSSGSIVGFLGASSDGVVRGNFVHDGAGSGIALDAGAGRTSGLRSFLVERNTATRCGSVGGSAINCGATLDSMIRNNVLYRNLAGGIAFSSAWGSGSLGIIDRTVQSIRSPSAPDNARNTVVANTVYFENGKGRACLALRERCPGFYIRNNIFWGGLGGVIFVSRESESGLNIDNNVILTYEGQTQMGDRYPTDVGPTPSCTFDQWRAKGFDKHSKFSVDPLFVSIPANDYRLRPGSPAIDAGRDVGERCGADFAGTVRPQGKAFDCGAYEYGEQSGGSGGDR